MSGRRRPRRWAWVLLAGTCAAAAVAVALVAWLNVRGEDDVAGGRPPTAATEGTPATVARGAYLARAGNCIGCHTAPGGAELAGGRSIDTPFGTVFASNLTPDPETGLGRWSGDDFWRALHHGRSRDGRLLYPAFPYPNFTVVTRADADALQAFLRSVPAVRQPDRPHALRFPYGTQAALAVWRALYFRPAVLQPQAGRTADWHRGRYLVQGLGHCTACHAGRDVLGGSQPGTDFTGGLMPDGRWFAPSLAAPGEAGVQRVPRGEVVALLRDGVSAHAAVSGPMAEVVFESTQYLDAGDLDAMATFLAAVPVAEPATADVAPAGEAAMRRGARLYADHCAACHGDRGQGVAGLYPALAGNRAVVLQSPVNVVQLIRGGGFLPATHGNPRPFGMPPLGQVLGDEDIAAVATFIRQSWGNRGAAVSALAVWQVP